MQYKILVSVMALVAGLFKWFVHTPQVYATPVSTQKYPTQEQLQELRDQLPARIPDILQYESYQAAQDPSALEQAAAFSEAWRAVNPAIAPFLGHWHGQDISVLVYPSFTPNQVCILTYEDRLRFDIQPVSEGQLNVTDLEGWRIQDQNQLVDKVSFTPGSFIREGDFLLWAYFRESGEPGKTTFFSPHPLISPNEVLPQDQQGLNLRRRFNAAGCTTRLPDEAHVPLELPQQPLTNLSITGSDTQRDVTIEINGGYKDPRSSNPSSFDVYLTVYNNSEQRFLFSFRNVEVSDSNGNPIRSRYVRDNDGVNIADSHGTLTGRVIIVQPWNTVESQNLEIVIKEATSGMREFRIPIVVNELENLVD
jgi:hypothetical protein